MTYLPGVTSESYLDGAGWAIIMATNRRAPVRAHLGLCCLIRSPRGPFRADLIVPLYRWYRRYAW